jgi:antitoxin component YwqK of YwqJK toxin-antitoxin module
MNKTLIILSLVLLVSCGVSQKDKNIAAVTCSIMGETRNMDAAVRVREMNDAREKIGGEPFLGGDSAIQEAFEWGLCQELVLNESYKEILQPLKDAKRERERIAAEKLAEEQRIAAKKLAEEKRLAAEKLAEENRIAAEKRAEEQRIAAEKQRIADTKPSVKEEFYSDGTSQDRSNFQSKNDGGKRHGSRERYHRNGQLWEKLNYANGELDGYAEVYFDNGQLSEKLNYANGELDGYAEFYFDNGEVERKINFKKGQLTGLNSWYKNDGRISSTNDYGDGTKKDYQDGKADLLQVSYFYHPNKQLKSKILTKNGESHGISEWFYEDGQLETIGTYINGKMDGLTSIYFENGEIKQKGIYKIGEKDGLFEWFYESGQLKVTTTYTNGQQDGFRTEYHDNGEIEMKGIYKNGEKDGLFEWFYESGQPKHISTYINGQQDGFETAYHDNGEIELKGIYKNGEYDGLFEWFDEKGKNISRECRMDGTVNQKFICRKDHPINP